MMIGLLLGSILRLPFDSSILIAIKDTKTLDLLKPGILRVFLMLSGDSKEIGLFTISSRFRLELFSISSLVILLWL